MKTPTTLVTGGAGFIGSHVVDCLLKAGHNVRVLDNFSTGKQQNLPTNNPSLEIVNGDITNHATINTVTKGVDFVVHMAAQTSVAASVENPLESFNTNMVGFAELLNALKVNGFKGKLVYASSAAVYGEPKAEKPLTENDANGVEVLSGYALEKTYMEKMAALHAKLYGLQAVGLRFFNVYGSRQNLSSGYSGVISVFIDKLKNNQPITIFGDGQQVRDFIYVQDVAEMVLKCLENNEVNGVFNLGSGLTLSLQQLIETLSQAIQCTPKLKYQGARAGDIKFSCADISKIKAIVPSLELTKFTEGIKELCK